MLGWHPGRRQQNRLWWLSVCLTFVALLRLFALLPPGGGRPYTGSKVAGAVSEEWRLLAKIVPCDDDLAGIIELLVPRQPAAEAQEEAAPKKCCSKCPSKGWCGAPRTLEARKGLTLDPTPDGDLLVAAQNESASNDEGKIALTSGTDPPVCFAVPALRNSPVFLIEDYGGKSLKVTNLSLSAPVQVAAYAPCYGGAAQPLPDDGAFVPIGPYCIRTGPTQPNYMQLIMKGATFTVFTTFFGADPTVYCLNASDPPPLGCAKSTQNNQITVMDNWQGECIYMVNLSAENSSGGEVALVDL